MVFPASEQASYESRAERLLPAIGLVAVIRGITISGEFGVGDWYTVLFVVSMVAFALAAAACFFVALPTEVSRRLPGVAVSRQKLYVWAYALFAAGILTTALAYAGLGLDLLDRAELGG